MTTFNANPYVEIDGDFKVDLGWNAITERLRRQIAGIKSARKIIVVEYYQGILEMETNTELISGIKPDLVIFSNDLMWPEEKISAMVYSDVTGDRIFGHLSGLTIDAYFNPEAIANVHKKIQSLPGGIILMLGTGAAYVVSGYDILVYADMARWEIQMRMRKGLVSNLGVNNCKIPDWMLLYKQGYFVDWRVCDRLKRDLIDKWDFVLDTNDNGLPKMTTGEAIREGLGQTLQRPFSVVPFFDPGPWGGQWMKEHCNLDKSKENYAWCFNCVPEENSLLLKIDGALFEIPSINLVLFQPRRLLGDGVYARFGNEFPIRFDFLDTMDGGNLSLQVHPLTGYIREKFGMQYTQDESYYMLDTKPGAFVYLGLKEGIIPDEMISDLEEAQQGKEPFNAEKYVETWPAKKHDHFLIPGGTVHCSGKNAMVLEISATPFIFTFKLWDWGRLGMDGRPRPINIQHGKNVIQWDRDTTWTRENLVNRIETIAEGDGWTEERTGLHKSEFIETRRHWFTKKITHRTHGGVNVLNLVEGDAILVESPLKIFKPFEVHYAETFIIPAAVDEYTIRPLVESTDITYATIKAFVRTSDYQ
jgi:mannose-6-phosphate isomerase class I